MLFKDESCLCNASEIMYWSWEYSGEYFYGKILQKNSCFYWVNSDSIVLILSCHLEVGRGIRSHRLISLNRHLRLYRISCLKWSAFTSMFRGNYNASPDTPLGHNRLSCLLTIRDVPCVRNNVSGQSCVFRVTRRSLLARVCDRLLYFPVLFFLLRIKEIGRSPLLDTVARSSIHI